jgi:transposase
MEYIGIDLHKRESQICIEDEKGGLLEERRIRTDRERFEAALGRRGRGQILIEASTESEWVAQCLEELGHEVIVADPNYSPMYSTRSRKVKTDRRDARTLADACRLGAYRRAHRTSEESRHVRAELAVRDALVRTRVKFVTLVGVLLRREGFRVRSGNVDGFLGRVEEVAVPERLKAEIDPMLALIRETHRRIREADQRVTAIVKRDPVIQRMCTIPGVGPLTATAFVSTLDQVERFDGAHQVESYLGLVPRERSSGEKQHKGRITKAGNSRARWLLVEAAWSIVRSRREETQHLREWTGRIALRRGRLVAIVALARRLAGILFAMWRDGREYEPRLTRRQERQREVAA